jgi:cytochrome c oxidase subunit 3
MSMNAMSLNKNKISQNMQHSWIHPQKFAMYLGIVVMCMMFAGLTSAYLVRHSAPNWTKFTLPINFYISAGIILASSGTLFIAARGFKSDRLGMYRIGLLATVVLSFGFIYSQYLGWQQMQEIGIYLAGNPAGSFVYVISWLHVVHVAVGIICLLIALVKSLILFRHPAQFLIYRTDGNKKIGIELLSLYWHFVDVLWLYLLLFFTFN